ncbi:MAG: hypothetical protein GY951_04035, partial [Psychromonas sp.]|nr:hypothetical protein [Psychromonas sp.]
IADGPVQPGGQSSQWKNGNYDVDALGGWYDAGDYIKFSLTNAVTAYYLTRAYETNPTIHKRVLSNTSYVDILDEAKHGLDYLVKLLPSDNIFINQVGSHKDHNQADRLPEDDILNGFDRPAFVAKYAPNMFLVAAALAHGSTVFKPFDEELSERYLNKAKQIWKAAQSNDVLDYLPYDREWFYPDESLNDNKALATTELYKATGDSQYLSVAKAIRLQAQYSASWASYSLSANQRLSEYDNNAKQQLGYELANYERFANNTQGNIWGLPSTIYWASLYNNLLVGAAAAEQAINGDEQYLSLAYDNLDYLYGKNNWGTSFVVSENVANSADQIYHQMYRLSGNKPIGAVSEGPVDRASLLDAFKSGAIAQPYKSEMKLILENSIFDTQKYIFVDHNRNYSNQETTIFGQAATIYLLSSVSALETEVVITPTPTVTPTPVITPTPTDTPTPVLTPTPTVTPRPVITPTPTVTPTPVITSTPTVTPTPVITPTPTVTPTPVITPTPTVTPT